MPQLMGMKKGSVSSHNIPTFPSPATFSTPATPNCHESTVGIQKGWSSERVPAPATSSRRHISAAALMPFNSGRALPSKWDDAERWITSPVSGYGGISKTSLYQAQRRPKSKSGPIGAPGIAYYSNYSPAMPVLEGRSVRSLMGPSSPFLTGVMMADGLSVHYRGLDVGQSYRVHNEHGLVRSSSLHGCSDLLSEASLPSSQDEKLDGTKDAETIASRAVSRRDMATQMSPEAGTHSSPEGWTSSSPFPPSLLPIMEPHNDHSSKLEVCRDVQVDKWATVLRWSKRYGTRMTKKDTPDVEDLYKSATEAQGSSWDVAEAAKKFQREEAKIIAWENLQKAKAEAAMRKLEMKLEKKRSSSMDKILNKLSMARIKAEEMRSSLSNGQAHQVSKTKHKVLFFCKNVQMGSLTGCFTCHTF